MELATNAFRVEDITLPKFYSVQFELNIDKPENDNGKNQLILALTDGLKNAGAAGNRDPPFKIETNDFNELIFVISSGTETRHEASITSEWYSKWLSFIIIRYLLVYTQP